MATTPVQIPFDTEWPDALRRACSSVAHPVVRDNGGETLQQKGLGELRTVPERARFPLRVEAQPPAGFDGGHGGYRGANTDECHRQNEQWNEEEQPLNMTDRVSYKRAIEYRDLSELPQASPRKKNRNVQRQVQRLKKKDADVHANGRPDIGVLITQLDRGTFGMRSNIHPDTMVVVNKYKLNDRATQHLVESMGKRQKTTQEDLNAIDARLASAERPSDLLPELLQVLDRHGKLPVAPKVPAKAAKASSPPPSTCSPPPSEVRMI
ncbi:unnamed protein product [Symbiodinium sp. CCMP2456]|nr:unnamed protein product [Symbiodinium sp. CCMP2456]